MMQWFWCLIGWHDIDDALVTVCEGKGTNTGRWILGCQHCDYVRRARPD